jgi:hypothetical protein
MLMPSVRVTLRILYRSSSQANPYGRFRLDMNTRLDLTVALRRLPGGPGRPTTARSRTLLMTM